MSETAAPEWVEVEEEGRVCALDGCENPLPAPAVDQDGRRKGGRPSAYCGKTHADAASRARRSLTVATVSDPLAEVRRQAENFEPAAGVLVELLQGMRQSFNEAETAALARVTEAEAQAAQARREVEEAQLEVVKAETSRTNALATARDDRLARAKAEKSAERATHDAETHRQRAWAEIAAHERARGAAESAAATAEAARAGLATEVRELREQLLAFRAEKTDLTRQLAEKDAALAGIAAERDVVLDRLDTARGLSAAAERDRDTARQEWRITLAELEQARERAGEEHTKRRLAEERATGLAADLTAAREQIATGQARLDQLLGQLTDLARPAPAEDLYVETGENTGERLGKPGCSSTREISDGHG